MPDPTPTPTSDCGHESDVLFLHCRNCIETDDNDRIVVAWVRSEYRVGCDTCGLDIVTIRDPVAAEREAAARALEEAADATMTNWPPHNGVAHWLRDRARKIREGTP